VTRAPWKARWGAIVAGAVLALLLGATPVTLADTQQPASEGSSSMVIPLVLALVVLSVVILLTRPRKKRP
jgi:peptidoglycan/LPS O-acetylase OafA/YrhL